MCINECGRNIQNLRQNQSPFYGIISIHVFGYYIGMLMLPISTPYAFILISKQTNIIIWRSTYGPERTHLYVTDYLFGGRRNTHEGV